MSKLKQAFEDKDARIDRQFRTIYSREESAALESEPRLKLYNATGLCA